MFASMTSMTTKTKRTYNLSGEAVEHVRLIAGHQDLPDTQDGVVEFAIERLYQEVRDREEAALWAQASQDARFKAELGFLAEVFDEASSWPQ